MKSLWLLQNDQLKSCLIVGLGNPGVQYENTRHNIGFRAVQEVARKYGMTFNKTSRLKGELAEKKVEGGKLLLLLPSTYMNLSGNSLRATLDYFKVSKENVIVVCDDKDLSLGTWRVRKKGSSGGHNGLKSIEGALETQEYARLRIGIGSPQRGEVLADYVLDQFTEEERGSLPKILEEATGVLNLWIKKHLSA